MTGNLVIPPASVLASWPAPNYDDPIRRTWMPEYAGTLQAFTTVFLATRLWLRSRGQAGTLGFDDVLLVPAYLAATMYTTLIIFGAERLGADRHTWDVPPLNFSAMALVAWLAQVAFLISTCSTKVSVLLSYRMLAKENYNKKWKYATIVAIVFTIAYCIAFVLSLVFSCTPTRAYWKSYDPSFKQDWHCLRTTYLNPLSGALSVLSDLYSVLLPMGCFWHLQLTVRQRWALNGVFALGLLVVGAGSVRTYYLTLVGYNYDVIWLGFDAFVWAHLEIQLAIICASIPSLRVLFRRYLRKSITRALTGTKSTTSSSTSTGGNSLPSGFWDRIGEDEESVLVADTGKVTLQSGPVPRGIPSPPQGQPTMTAGNHDNIALEDLRRPKQPQAAHVSGPRVSDDWAMSS